MTDTASQVLLFISLPQLLSKIFNSHKQIWSLYQTLRDITSLIFSEEIQLEMIERLTKIIGLFLKSFKTVFPDSTIAPKLHYLSHYPEMFKKFGPFIRFGTLRFERKHLYFKQILS